MIEAFGRGPREPASSPRTRRLLPRTARPQCCRREWDGYYRQKVRKIIESIEGLGQPVPRTASPRWFLLIASAAWCAAIIVAPLLDSSTAYAFFSLICHQDPARSWFLQGEPLGVCVRCASIYGGFLIGIVAGIRPRTWLLRVSLLTLGLEFSVARLGLDLEGARAVSGLLLGLATAGFVEQGVRELIRHPLIGRTHRVRRSAT